MKYVCLVLLTFFSFIGKAQSQASDKECIDKTIRAYSRAGDTQNVKGLSSTLHDEYRLVWFGGTEEPFISDKSGFLSQFEAKKWGGDQRQVSILAIETFDGFNASAKVILDGEKAQMRNFFTLLKVNGKWLIIGELVNATFK